MTAMVVLGVVVMVVTAAAMVVLGVVVMVITAVVVMLRVVVVFTVIQNLFVSTVFTNLAIRKFDLCLVFDESSQS